MKEIDGDLIKLSQDGHFEVMVHGCNCHCQMGAGIAKQVREECVEAYMVDRLTIPGDKSKLGTISYATIEPIGFVCVNAYSQYDYTHSKVDADYDAIRSCFKAIKKTFSGQRIGIPLIGAGLAGGNWDIISAIINEELVDEDLTLVRFKQ